MVVVAQRLQVRRVVILLITVNVVNCQLTRVHYLEVASLMPLAIVLFMDCPWALNLCLYRVVLCMAAPVNLGRLVDVANSHGNVRPTLTAVCKL